MLKKNSNLSDNFKKQTLKQCGARQTKTKGWDANENIAKKTRHKSAISSHLCSDMDNMQSTKCHATNDQDPHASNDYSYKDLV